MYALYSFVIDDIWNFLELSQSITTILCLQMWFSILFDDFRLKFAVNDISLSGMEEAGYKSEFMIGYFERYSDKITQY